MSWKAHIPGRLWPCPLPLAGWEAHWFEVAPVPPFLSPETWGLKVDGFFREVYGWYGVIIFAFFFLMFICMCLCMYKFTYVCGCMSKWKAEVNLRCRLQSTSLLVSFETESLSGLNLWTGLWWLTSQLQESSRLYFSSTGIAVMYCRVWPFNKHGGTDLGSLGLHGKHLGTASLANDRFCSLS